MNKQKQKNVVYVGFMDLEVYDRVNREASWQMLGIYYVHGKLLSEIKTTYAHSLAYVRVKGGNSEWFNINSCVRKGCIISPWIFNVYMDAVMKEVTEMS